MTSKVDVKSGRRTTDGQKFGRWTVQGEPFKYRYDWFVMCVCECGAMKPVTVSCLAKGGSRGCRNCASNQRMDTTKTKYPREYAIWMQMKGKCVNPKHHEYNHYGLAGIRIDRRWEKSFDEFLADMGPRPSNEHTLHRKSLLGDFNKANCYWSDEPQRRIHRTTGYDVPANKRRWGSIGNHSAKLLVGSRS